MKKTEEGRRKKRMVIVGVVVGKVIVAVVGIGES